MRQLQQISERASEARLPFLIIGGYAVLAHGYVRATDDLDLLVQAGQREQWRQLLGDLGLSIKNEAPTFLQFNAPPGNRIDVDLMFVAEEVFGRMAAVAMASSVEGISVRVVALLHLVALKCHALKHSKSLRRLKDLDDLIQLISLNRLDLNGQSFERLSSSMATRNSTKNSDSPVTPSEGLLHDASGLEFPSWDGKLPHRSRLTFEQAVRWNEEMLTLFPPGRESKQSQIQLPCPVEFVL